MLVCVEINVYGVYIVEMYRVCVHIESECRHIYVCIYVCIGNNMKINYGSADIDKN